MASKLESVVANSGATVDVAQSGMFDRVALDMFAAKYRDAVDAGKVKLTKTVDDPSQLESKSTTATLIFIDSHGAHHAITPLGSITCRGVDFPSMVAYLASQIAYDHAVPHNLARWIDFYLADNLYIHVSIKRSGSQCDTCGAVRGEDGITSWCRDADGCDAWRVTPEKAKAKRGTLDIAGALAQL